MICVIVFVSLLITMIIMALTINIICWPMNHDLSKCRKKILDKNWRETDEDYLKRCAEEDKTYQKNCRDRIACITCLALVAIIVFTGGIALGININNNAYRTFASEFEAQKYTIETSLTNEDLTGFDRLELVKQASNLNRQLAQKKVETTYWYNFHIDDTILENIECINLGEK